MPPLPSSFLNSKRLRNESARSVTLYSIGTGYQLSAISYQLSAISYQLSAISYQLSAISYQLSAISYQHFIFYAACGRIKYKMLVQVSDLNPIFASLQTGERELQGCAAQQRTALG